MQKISKIIIPAVLALMFIFLTWATSATANVVDEPILHPPIPLLDEDGNHVLDSAKPYSPKQSCGSSSCHDYDKISHAYHFEMGRDEASDDFGAKRGLPHLVSPGYFGGYTCMGGSNPEVLAKKKNATADDFADQGSAGLVKRCVGCHTGGGWMEKDRHGTRYDETNPASITELDGDYFNRGTDSNNNKADVNVVSRWDWNKSGVVEADCMLCHTDFNAMQKFDPKLGANDGSDGTDSAYDHFKDLRNNVLVKNGNYFRYAATGIMEFLNLSHPDSNVNDMSMLTFEREIKADSSDPDYSLTLDADELPIINWNTNAFDENRKALIPMLRFPANDNCMLCHRTSNSRRGFYGYGEAASATYSDSEDGALEEDYRDDVHKGKTWTEPNGETRAIENCNSCHSQNYFKESFANVDLNADHNFLKGNSDMDVRNDLDFNANAKSCEYCHNDAPQPAELAIPSGHEDMLSAHREIWKANGDMAGYPQAELTKITKTHLDIVNCQSCHITDKAGRGGTPIQIMYRYRADTNNDLKIMPYNPRLRYYWKDRSSGYVFNKTERNSAFELREKDGDQYGAIIDGAGNEIGQVSVRMSHGSLRFGDPEDYNGVMSLKNAYDDILISKGISNPDAVMVWTESNEYVMSHNVRSSPSSVQCQECHDRKANGSFSSIVSVDGLFGAGNSKTVTTLVDPKLFSEGVVELDFSYMKMDSAGKVTENVSDILYATKVDPSMSVLHSATAPIATGIVKRMPVSSGILASGVTSSDDTDTLEDLFPGEEVFFYSPNYGNRFVRAVSLMPEANGQTELLFPTYKMEVALAESQIASSAADSGLGELSSQVFSIKAIDKNSHEVNSFAGNQVVVKLPYEGTASSVNEIKVIYSKNGNDWTPIASEKIILIQAHSDEIGVEAEGYITFQTDHFSHYAIVNNTPATTAPAASDSKLGESRSSGGGGSLTYTILLLALLGLYRLLHSRRLS